MSRPQTFDERSAGFAERTGFLRMDPLIAFAGIGLIACSVIALGAATQSYDLGSYYYVIRQIDLRRGRDRAACSRSPASTTRASASSGSASTRDDLLIVAVLLFGSAARGSRRWIELPFFRFQPSELGKVLLVLSLAAFVIDRARRQSEAQRTARLLLLGLAPAALVFLQPDLGTALVYGAITLAVLFIAGVPWTHFAALGGLAVAR